ncbi:transposase [Empedobacter falsenii]
MEKFFIGIDVSKLTLDFCVKTTSCQEHYQIDNEVKSIKKFFKKFNNSSEIIVAMENTGRYNFLLYEVLSTLELSVFVINSLHLKRSIGLTRGKNDKIDSQRICLYIEKNYMDLQKWKLSSTIISKKVI